MIYLFLAVMDSVLASKRLGATNQFSLSSSSHVISEVATLAQPPSAIKTQIPSLARDTDNIESWREGIIAYRSDCERHDRSHYFIGIFAHSV
jgi:hypothetical protein